MREIKFRAKAINDGFYKGEWVHGYYLKSLCGGKLVDVITDGANEIPIQIDTLGQFTGLYDKNIRKIYEGDVLKVASYRNIGMSDCFYTINELKEFTMQELKGEQQKEEIGEVGFEDGEFVFSDYHLAAFFGDMRFSNPIFEFEIIGNIFDNKELIK